MNGLERYTNDQLDGCPQQKKTIGCNRYNNKWTGCVLMNSLGRMSSKLRSSSLIGNKSMQAYSTETVNQRTNVVGK